MKKEEALKRIEQRHSKLLFLEKRNIMNDRNIKRNIQTDAVVNEISPIEIQPISIIITAYQTENFIEECLDSIENQTCFINNNDFEILVGVDACQNTLDKLLNIHHKYRNLRIFMMKSNMGTYITTNTLLNLVKYDNVLRFDSDDIMLPELIKEIMKNINKFDVMRIKCNDFIVVNNRRETTEHYRYAAGIIFYKKNILNIIGGYKPWSCAADSELIERINKITKIGYLKNQLFSRRVHANSLSQKTETNLASKIRKDYHDIIIQTRTNNSIYVEKKINKFIEY